VVEGVRRGTLKSKIVPDPVPRLVGAFLNPPFGQLDPHGLPILAKLPGPMIPTFDQFLRPILALAVKGPITRRSIQPLLAEQFKLTEAEVSQRIPSGSSTILANRSGWAMTFLTKAGLIQKVSPKTYSASPAGLAILKSHPSDITEADLKQLPGWEEA